MLYVPPVVLYVIFVTVEALNKVIPTPYSIVPKLPALRLPAVGAEVDILTLPPLVVIVPKPIHQ